MEKGDHKTFLEAGAGAPLLMLLPRFVRLRDAPGYLGMDKNKFNKLVRPALTEVRLGSQAVAFDRLELDAWASHYIERNGRRPRASIPEDDICQKEAKCRVYASEARSGTSKNAVSTVKADGSTKAREHLAGLKQKSS